MLKEVEGCLQVLEGLRGEIKKTMEGLPRKALDWQPIQGEGDLATNSMTAMVVHLTGSETFLLGHTIGGRDIKRDRDAEFKASGLDLAELEARLDKAGSVVKEILSGLKAEQMEEMREFRDRRFTVRWGILYVIKHYAVHLGHMQLTRQLWMARNDVKNK